MHPKAEEAMLFRSKRLHSPQLLQPIGLVGQLGSLLGSNLCHNMQISLQPPRLQPEENNQVSNPAAKSVIDFESR